jgi:hypothetical protein
LSSKTSSQTQQNTGLAAILIGMAVAITANFTDSDSVIMTAVALLAAAGMLILGIFGLRGGGPKLDILITFGVMALFIVGSVFHAKRL